MKNKLGGKIKVCCIESKKKYSYLTDDKHEIKKAKDPKNVRLKNTINRFNRNTWI